jgi:hypothetical protein
MIDSKDKPLPESNPVDWSDPQLQKLLGKIESWNLDNREIHPRRNVQVQVGWKAAGSNDAVLVWKRDKVMVIEASFVIPAGEYVRIDTLHGDSMRRVWGVVVDGRPGRREEDCANRVNVYWLHEC